MNESMCCSSVQLSLPFVNPWRSIGLTVTLLYILWCLNTIEKHGFKVKAVEFYRQAPHDNEKLLIKGTSVFRGSFKMLEIIRRFTLSSEPHVIATIEHENNLSWYANYGTSFLL